MQTSTDTNLIRKRQHWMAVLAQSSIEDLKHALASLPDRPVYQYLRQHETGSLMVRGRIGGTGQPFNLGETTVLRCTVKLNEGYVGTAYVMGSNHCHAELAAVFDALLQNPEGQQQLVRKEYVIRPDSSHDRRQGI